MRKHLFAGTLLIAFFTNTTALAAPLQGGSQTYTIQGAVRNETDRTPLKDVSVFSETSDKQAVTNENGRYQLRIPSTDTHQKIRFEKAGYDPYYADFNIYGDTTLNVLLEPEGMDPDLTITDMSVDPGVSPAVTDPVYISVTIKNIGEESLNPGKTPVKLMVYDQTSWGFEYELNDESQELGPGEEFTYESLLPYVQRGRKLRINPHLFTATIDSENTVEENDETNNTFQTSVRFHNDKIILIDNFFLSDETQSNYENPLVLSWNPPKRGDYSSSDIKYIATNIGEPDPYGTVFYSEMTTETGVPYSVGYLEEKYLGEVDRSWSTLGGAGGCTSSPVSTTCGYEAEDLTGPKTYFFIVRYALEDSNDYVYSNVLRVDFYGETEPPVQGKLTIKRSGTLTNPTVGQKQAKIAEFRIEALNENIQLTKTRLKIGGTINPSQDLSNFRLASETHWVSEDSAADSSGYVDLASYSPYGIPVGSPATFFLYSDISSTSTGNETIQVYLENPSDLEGEEVSKGYRVEVDNSDYDGEQTSDPDGDGVVPDSSNTTVQNLSPALIISSSTTTKDYAAISGQNVPFLELSLTSQRNIEVRQLTLTIDAASADTAYDSGDLLGNTVANFTDIRIKDDKGTTLMGPKELSFTTSTSVNDVSQTLTFTGSWTMNVGETKNLLLTMDVANNSDLSKEDVRITLESVPETGLIRDRDTGEYITDISPNTDINGKYIKFDNPTLTASLAPIPASKSVLPGEQNFDSVGFYIFGDPNHDMYVETIGIYAFYDENGDGYYGYGYDNGKYVNDVIQSIELWDEYGNKVASAQSINDYGYVYFYPSKWLVPRGTTVKLLVRIPKVEPSAPQGGNDDRVAFDMFYFYGTSDNSTSFYNYPYPNGSTKPNVVTTISATSSLQIANAYDPVKDAKYVAGQDALPAAKFRVKASGQDFIINKMNFQVTNLSSSATNDVDRVYLVYPDRDGNPITSQKQVLTGTTTKLANFQNLNFYIPRDNENIEFTVYIDTNTIESGAAKSGSQIRVDFDATDSTDEFEAIGQTNGITINDDVTSGDADVSNNNHVALYKTLPTFATNTTTSGCPTNSTKPTGGTNNIYCFDVTANANGPIDLYKVVLQVATAGITISSGSVKLYDYADQSTILATASVSSGKATFTLSTPDTIAAGQKVTYLIKADLTIDSSAQKVTISTKVLDDTTFAANAAAASVSGNVVWSDRSASSHSTSTTDWTNGYKVSGLPTDQVSMSL